MKIENSDFFQKFTTVILWGNFIVIVPWGTPDDRGSWGTPGDYNDKNSLRGTLYKNFTPTTPGRPGHPVSPGTF